VLHFIGVAADRRTDRNSLVSVGRRRDVVLWGAMQFSGSGPPRRGRRMERLEEMLLIGRFRLAAVAALVARACAADDPQHVAGAFDGSGGTILILDNSMSMSRVVGGESAADQMA